MKFSIKIWPNIVLFFYKRVRTSDHKFGFNSTHAFVIPIYKFSFFVWPQELGPGTDYADKIQRRDKVIKILSDCIKKDLQEKFPQVRFDRPLDDIEIRDARFIAFKEARKVWREENHKPAKL